ncbi:YdeI/OmpD-associated family protein [Mucilaginibacter sp. cycad4]|uniref:YdeI/OmpD-associated family protein n=1 Tax=Mucilaginibacter sp. cycad4 TaxID=3342096 RepID=UPI002AABCE99|nr:YdeI/OmpD-associated family protein [Mucilaginibacter gossypii]WPU97816.1 YdeI/OmpD-associated family protein [Mucilaginibacter gossypii]
MNHNSEIDTYIANAGDFAKPILAHWRMLIHERCPDVTEVMKWGIPHFEYKNENIFVFASYTNHCSFSFLKESLMTDPRLKANKDLKPIQKFLGKIRKREDLPQDEEFVSMLDDAMLLNEKGIKVKREKPANDKPKILETPDYLLAALTGNSKAKEVFESKSNSFRKEYIVWISDAKTDETRQKRINEALEWIAEGKSRFWKHQ